MIQIRNQWTNTYRSLVTIHIVICDTKLDLVEENILKNPRILYSGQE